VWIKAGKPVDKTGETTSLAPKKKHLSPSTRRRNAQWKNDQLMSSLLIFKYPMSHGTMKYTLAVILF
jgi:hypothetical protein